VSSVFRSLFHPNNSFPYSPTRRRSPTAPSPPSAMTRKVITSSNQTILFTADVCFSF
jgi:hypothetical protein